MLLHQINRKVVNNLSTTSSSVDATSCKRAGSTNHTLIIRTKPLSQMQPVADEKSSSEEQPLPEPSRCRRNRDMFPMMGMTGRQRLSKQACINQVLFKWNAWNSSWNAIWNAQQTTFELHLSHSHLNLRQLTTSFHTWHAEAFQQRTHQALPRVIRDMFCVFVFDAWSSIQLTPWQGFSCPKLQCALLSDTGSTDDQILHQGQVWWSPGSKTVRGSDNGDPFHLSHIPPTKEVAVIATRSRCENCGSPSSPS